MWKRTAGERFAKPTIAWPDRPNNKVIGVKGAGVAQVHEVVADFASGYDAPGFMTDAVTLGAVDNGCMIRFPRDIPPNIFLYLVNYLKYPIDRTPFDDPQGRCTIDEDFGPLGAPHIGAEAFAYVSEDSDYDTIRLLFLSGEAWEFSFREGGGWTQLANESRKRQDFWVGNA